MAKQGRATYHRLDEDLDEALRRRADEEDRPVAKQISRYVREGLRRDGVLPDAAKDEGKAEDGPGRS